MYRGHCDPSNRCYTRPMPVSVRLLPLLLFPVIALAEAPQYWPQGWYPMPYYPMPPPPAHPAVPAGPPPSSPAVDATAASSAASPETPEPDSAGQLPDVAGDGRSATAPDNTAPAAEDSGVSGAASVTAAGSATPADSPEPVMPARPAVAPATEVQDEAAAETLAREATDPGAGAAGGSTEGAASPKVETVDVTALHAEALQSMRAGDYAEAFCIWRPLAEAGDPRALFSLGWMYHNGYGLAIDDKKTVSLWQRAADADFADAAFALGMLYGFGDGGVPRDLPRAVGYLVQAVRLGHDDARQMLRNLMVENPRELAAITTDWDMALWRMLASTAQVRVERANVRQAPGTDQQIVARLEQGDRVLTLGEQGRWQQVVLPDGRLAWIYARLLEPATGAGHLSMSGGAQVSNR